MRTFQTRSPFVWGLAFDRTGTRLAAGGGGNASFTVWDLDGREEFTKSCQYAVEGLDFSPDGKRLAGTTREDHLVWIWGRGDRRLDSHAGGS